MVRESQDGKQQRKPSSEQRRAYNRARNWFFVAGIIWSTVTSVAFIYSGASRRLAQSSRARARNERGGEALAISIFMLLSWLVTLPLGYLRGYRLEHKYELSNQTHVSWLTDHLKALALQLVLLVPLTQIALAVIRRRPKDWWAILSAMALPFTVVLAHLAPVLIAPLFNTYRPLRDEQLGERLKALAARSGIQVADVLEMDMSRQTRKANAMFAGLGNTKRIVLADTLLDEFTADEIETIVAHEIGHQAHGDIWRLLTIGTVTTAAVAWLTHRGAQWLTNRPATQAAGVRDLGQAEAIPMLGLVAGLAGLLFMPIQNAFSRAIERRTDDYALRLTNNPDAFASALEKLADLNLADPEPPKIEEVLLHSHPSIKSRIAACQQFQQRTSAQSR